MARSGIGPGREAELRPSEETSQLLRLCPHTRPCVPAGVRTGLSYEDDVVQVWLEAPVPEVQGDVESLAPANDEVVKGDLLRVVPHVVPGALEVSDGQLQPCDGAAGADERAGLWGMVQPCPPLTSCANSRKKFSLSEPHFPSR